ncbi:MAG: aldehyde dehydrogenase family protein [Anaerolineales bacterium]|nr:aldehyde dehydrogenase family protein [Anaerolineales bacterium]
MKAILDKLGIQDINAGACFGPNGWLTTDGPTIISNNPTTGKPIATIMATTPDAYDQIVTHAMANFEKWRATPAPKRGLLVRDLGNATREVLEPLGELISLEMGKIRAEGIGEVQEMIDICDFALGLSRQLYGLTMHSERPGHRMYEQWHPLGAIGVITAFNFPCAVWSWNAAIAAVCGNTVLWKPSELALLTAVALQNIANRVMADHGVTGIFNLVAGGPQIGQRLSEDERLPLVSFTGSTRVGRLVGQTVAGRFGKSLLELGGNNAIIVAPDADLDLATRAILFGAVGTAGQRCTTTRRIIMHESVAADLSNRLVNAYQQVRIGDPLAEGTLMGPLATERAVEAMQTAVSQALAEGGEVLTGGSTRSDIGPQFVEPTIIKMPRQSSIVKQETFAPILYLLTYSDLEEALTLHNDVPQGLSSAIFTDSMRTAEAFLGAAGSDCGIANVNIGTSGAEIGGAFGGEKETGGGRESGSDAWRAYMRRQTNTINWSNSLPLAQGIEFG